MGAKRIDMAVVEVITEFIRGSISDVCSVIAVLKSGCDQRERCAKRALSFL